MPYKELGTRLRQGIQSRVVNELRDEAPEQLDTFKETADAISSIKKYQKYINTDLDYAIFEPLAKSSTFVVCKSVKYGNLSIDEDGYIILKPNKKYNVFVDLYNTITTTGMWLVDKNDNQVSVGKSTGSLGFLNIETSDEIHVAIKFNLGASLETEWCDIIVQEVGRAIVIDPLEHVNMHKGIEDIPVGNIITYMGAIAPKHYLICDGSEYNIADYPVLAEHFKEEYGSYNKFGGDGITTFCVPSYNIEVSTSNFPKMTSETTPTPYKITCSNQHSGYPAWKAFTKTNNAENDCWGATVPTNQWIMIDLGEPRSFTKMELSSRYYNTTDGYGYMHVGPKDFALQGSNNGVDFDTIFSHEGETWTVLGETKKYEFTSKAYRYYRLYVYNTNGNTNIMVGHWDLINIESSICKLIKYEPTYFMEVQNTNYLMPTLYSQEERVIGSWINGKPLYQKTYELSVNAGENDISVSDIDEIVFTEGYGYGSDGYRAFFDSDLQTSQYQMVIVFNKELQFFRVTVGTERAEKAIITIKYTKTTDIENSFTNDMIKDFIVNGGSNNDDPSYGTGPSCNCPTYTDDEVDLAIDEVLYFTMNE